MNFNVNSGALQLFEYAAMDFEVPNRDVQAQPPVGGAQGGRLKEDVPSCSGAVPATEAGSCSCEFASGGGSIRILANSYRDVLQ
jgi:hypothetical protein